MVTEEKEKVIEEAKQRQQKKGWFEDIPRWMVIAFVGLAMIIAIQMQTGNVKPRTGLMMIAGIVIVFALMQKQERRKGDILKTHEVKFFGEAYCQSMKDRGDHPHFPRDCEYSVYNISEPQYHNDMPTHYLFNIDVYSPNSMKRSLMGIIDAFDPEILTSNEIKGKIWGGETIPTKFIAPKLYKFKKQFPELFKGG